MYDFKRSILPNKIIANSLNIFSWRKKLFSGRFCCARYIWIIKGRELQCVSVYSLAACPLYIFQTYFSRNWSLSERLISFDLSIFSIILISWPQYLFHSISKGDGCRSSGLDWKGAPIVALQGLQTNLSSRYQILILSANVK